jgi:hypothetical protein
MSSGHRALWTVETGRVTPVFTASGQNGATSHKTVALSEWFKHLRRPCKRLID